MGAEIRKPRATRRYTSTQLAALTGQAAVPDQPVAAASTAKTAGKAENETGIETGAETGAETGNDEPTAEVTPVVPAAARAPTRSRSATLEDPMTTAMLAEVARRAQTVDFDEKLIEDVVNNIGKAETSHPHTRRRSR